MDIEPAGVCILSFSAYDFSNYIQVHQHSAVVPCPISTMRNETGETGVADCHPCMGGSYCCKLVDIEPAGICKLYFSAYNIYQYISRYNSGGTLSSRYNEK